MLAQTTFKANFPFLQVFPAAVAPATTVSLFDFVQFRHACKQLNDQVVDFYTPRETLSGPLARAIPPVRGGGVP